MRLRPTRRGVGLVALGLVVGTAGTAFGSTDLLTIGTLPVLLVVAGLIGVGALDHGHGRGRGRGRGQSLRTRRSVQPDPVHVGRTAQVLVEVSVVRGVSRARLTDLRLREQAAVELSGGRPLRAQVTREPRTVQLRYPVQATQRGRWPLGPLVVTRTDPFGVARVSATLGARETVTVWPAVVDLPVPRELLVAEPERSVVGARSPAADDAALRDYQLGDDLRRVHWRSSARRGELVVRSDERAGMRPVTVLLDQSEAGDTLEWSIELAASVALAVRAAGHPTHLLTGTAVDDPAAVRIDSPARQQLLDATVDLTGQPDAGSAERALLAEIRRLDDTDGGSGLVVAVLGAQGQAGRAALAGVSQTRPSWAIIRGDDGDEAASATAHSLRRAGWRVVQAGPGDDIAATWWRLTGAAA